MTNPVSPSDYPRRLNPFWDFLLKMVLVAFIPTCAGILWAARNISMNQAAIVVVQKTVGESEDRIDALEQWKEIGPLFTSDHNFIADAHLKDWARANFVGAQSLSHISAQLNKIEVTQGFIQSDLGKIKERMAVAEAEAEHGPRG